MVSSIGDHGSGWSSLWDTGDSGLWDRGKPSPALVDILEDDQRRDLFDPSTSDGKRKKALVPVFYCSMDFQHTQAVLIG